ncbi:hypothetical protein IPJ72_05905 [Candidatus Peregrinibacteria bacterium]|nr:MAG: hypothetical protein IPJ72_05905 [Candidatus Peregrinibacteria bacterium]
MLNQNTQKIFGSKPKWAKALVAAVAVLAIGILGYLGSQSTGLFKAALTEIVNPARTANLYIPGYNAGAQDSGTVRVYAANPTATDIALYSVSFRLQFSPNDALIFNGNSIVMNNGTLFRSADLQAVNTSVPGEVTVSLFSNAAPVLAAGSTQALFELALQTNAPVGSSITLTASNVEVVERDPTGLPMISTRYTALETSPIQIQNQNNLRLLQAEVLDATHVRLQFSDLLTNISDRGDYSIVDVNTNNALAVTNVEAGSTRGYDQSNVVLTTDPQTPGAQYEVVIGTPINNPTVAALASNTAGGMNFAYSRAPMIGFGRVNTTISDFAVVSATAANYDTLNVTFSDVPEPASINAGGIRITTGVNGGQSSVLSTTLNGNVLSITTQPPVMRGNTYVITFDNEAASGVALRRASDNAVLGLNVATAAGYKAGPQITRAVATSANTVEVTFDENVQVVLPNATVGHWVVTGDSANPVLIPASSVQIVNNVMTIQNVPNTANNNYTLALRNNLSNASRQAIDTRYNSVSVWGFGSTVGPNAVAGATLTRGNTIEVAPGSLNFSAVTPNQVSIFYYDLNAVVQNVTGISVSVAGNGNLSILTPANSILNDQHYHVRIGGALNTPPLAVAEFAMPNDFEMTAATATLSNQIRLSFSENINENTLSANAFTIHEWGTANRFNPITTTVQTGFRDVILQTQNTLNPGAVYVVESNTGLTNAVRSFVAGKVVHRYLIPLTGFQTQSAPSPVRLTAVTPLSATELELRFSADITPTSLTPINVQLTNRAAGNLTVSQVTTVDARTLRLTTTQQTPDAQYFVTLINTLDANGLLIQNNPIPSFFGYMAPVISVLSVTPSVITNDVDQVVVVAGQNLDGVQSARLGNTAVTLNQQTATAMNVVVPAGFAEGAYDLILTSSTGQNTTLSNAVTVTVANQPMRIVSAESRSLPNRVAPNGTTQVTFWVLVEAVVDISSVESVTIDLEAIGGSRAQEMTPDPGLQPRNRQFYTYTTTVSPNTPTQSTPYVLAVQARRGAEVANGTVEINVTRDILSSQAPAFEQAYSNPATVAPDGATTVTISARVTDPDGADSISSVVADLGSMGLGFIPLNPLQIAGSASELVTGFYATSPFTVPATTQEKNYTITLIATDNTGESTSTTLTLSVSSALTAPTIDETRTHVTPRQSLPKDGTTPFQISASVTDPDGVDDIDSVVAYFGSLGIAPVELTLATNASTSGRSGLFSSGNIVVPTTAPLGVHDIEIIATDESGGTGRLIVRIDVNDKDILGDAPLVFSDRSYTNPAMALNDGATRVSLYAFVRDDDRDLDSVVVNLSGVGQVGAQTPASFTPSNSTTNTTSGTTVSSGNCPTNSTIIACMQPSFQEGNEGRWYVLPDVTINTSTQSGQREVQVIATDKTGKTGRGTIRITVRDQNGSTAESEPPRMVAAVPVGPGSLEVAFSKPLMATSIRSSGANFTITARNDIADRLGIVGATVHADGTVITLTTDTQTSGQEYLISVDDQLTDLGGVAPLSNNRLSFMGYSESTRPPVVHFIGSTGPNNVQIEFQSDVRPSSISTDSVQVFEVDSGRPLAVKSVTFDESGKALVVTTATQQSATRYRVELAGVVSDSGIGSREKLVKFFTAETFRAAAGSQSSGATGNAVERADFNGDGKVDFVDFTIFSSVYGQSIGGTTNQTNASLRPITPTPDALVPTTSSTN